MLLIKLCDHSLYHGIGILKTASEYRSERHMDDRPLVHPRLAKFLIICYFQPTEYGAAVLSDIKKFCQHTHIHSFSKPPGPGNQCNLDSRCF